MLGAVSARLARNAVVCVLVAGLVFASAATAAGSGTSLTVAKRTVSSKSMSVVVTGAGKTVYELGGESLAKLKCLTTACLKIWMPVTVSSATAKVTVAKGVPGTASVLHRVKAKLYQVMLDRHPLYTYAGDSNGSAKGQGIKSYGGSWHVVVAATAMTTGARRPAEPVRAPQRPGNTRLASSAKSARVLPASSIRPEDFSMRLRWRPRTRRTTSAVPAPTPTTAAAAGLTQLRGSRIADSSQDSSSS